MWRSTVFSENENSDQSISEDDDLTGDLLEDHVSLGIPAEKKGEVQIISQLDMLRDSSEVMHQRSQNSLLQEGQADMGVEDDVEFPVFANGEFTYTPQKAYVCNSDDEILSDNEVHPTRNSDAIVQSFGGNRKDGVCSWLAANAEADTLDVNDAADYTLFHPVSARAKRSCKGGQVKAKRKFSIRTQSHNDNLFVDISHVHENHPSMKGKEIDESAEFPVSHAHTATSMAELLVSIQDEHDLPEGSTRK